MISVYSQIKNNRSKSSTIVLVFCLFLVTISYLFAKTTGVGSPLSVISVVMIVSGLMSFAGYYYSDRIILSISHAHEASRNKDFNVYTSVENMAIACGLPKPKVYIIEDSAVNAFATGRDPQHGVICLTRGIIDKLERREIEGVIAHEMSHIQNYDTLLMSLVSVLVGSIVLLSDWFTRSLWWRGRKEKGSSSGILLVVSVIFIALSPFMAMLMQLAISRRREYLADASAAIVTRNPDDLANALEKIAGDHEVLEAATNATAHLYISNPFKQKNFSAFFSELFNTHPPIEKRIEILRQM